jgi:Fe-S-cluster-containing hydrogenase component 2
MKGLSCLLIRNYEDLSKKDLDELTCQDVDVDDWNCMLICPPSAIKYDYETLEYRPHEESEVLGRLLSHYDNKVVWYLVNFRGKQKAIGIQYH